MSTLKAVYFSLFQFSINSIIPDLHPFSVANLPQHDLTNGLINEIRNEDSTMRVFDIEGPFRSGKSHRGDYETILKLKLQDGEHHNYPCSN